jgi:hypothetical protein
MQLHGASHSCPARTRPHLLIPLPLQSTGIAGGKPGFKLTFRHRVETEAKLYFAFTYPFSLARTGKHLLDLDERLGNRADALCTIPWPSVLTPRPSMLQAFEARSHLTATHRSVSSSKLVSRNFLNHATSGKVSHETKPSVDASNIYYCREVITHSLDGVPIELLTISSFDGWIPGSVVREPVLECLFPFAIAGLRETDGSTGEEKSMCASSCSTERGLTSVTAVVSSPTPRTRDDSDLVESGTAKLSISLEEGDVSDSDSEFGEEPRALLHPSLPLPRALHTDSDKISIGTKPASFRPLSCVFSRKRVVIITGRVHSGETPASFALEGMLQFLTDALDPRAQELRKRFVFCIIPHLNPDGVRRGHWRFDQRGVNLNRCYIDPNPTTEPSIYAAKVSACNVTGRWCACSSHLSLCSNCVCITREAKNSSCCWTAMLTQAKEVASFSAMLSIQRKLKSRRCCIPDW